MYHKIIGFQNYSDTIKYVVNSQKRYMMGFIKINNREKTYHSK